MMAFTPLVHAGKSSGGTTTTTGAFNFTYNMGTVMNYHVYGIACQVGTVSPQPKGTVTLGTWWVWDLGRATGVGTVSCPKPIVPKGTQSSVLGILLFANVNDIGGQPLLFPAVDVQIFNSKWYNGYASIEVMEPNGSGLQLYWGPPFTPFSWDLSPYVYDVVPAPL